MFVFFFIIFCFFFLFFALNFTVLIFSLFFCEAKCDIVLIKTEGLRNVHAVYQCPW